MTRVYSFSRLSLYETCPLRFYFKYVDEREEELTLPLALGSAVHKAIERILLGNDLKNALLEGWMKVDYYPFDPKEYKELVLKAPVKQGDGLRKDKKVEFHFELPLSDDLLAPKIQGYIDYLEVIYGVYYITDWKTNRKKYAPMDTMQLPLYAWALSKIFKTNRVQGTLYFLRYFKNAKETMTFTPEHMEKARKWALKLAEEIEEKLIFLSLGDNPTDLFPCKPSASCKHCPFSIACIEKTTGGILYAN